LPTAEFESYRQTLDRVLGLTESLTASDPARETAVPSPAELQERLRSGIPMLVPERIHVRPGYAVEFLDGLGEILREVNSADLPEAGRRYLAAYSSGRVEADSFLRATLHDDTRYFAELARSNELDLAFLVFAAVYLGRPVRGPLAARSREQVDLASWSGGNCPCCGHWPAHSRLDTKGKRFLWCNCCATEWRFPRLRCPYCGNDDQDTLHHFEVEANTGRRVDACGACRRYLKVKLAASHARDFDRENLLTFPLDIAAVQEGYVLEIHAPIRSERRPDSRKGGLS